MAPRTLRGRLTLLFGTVSGLALAAVLIALYVLMSVQLRSAIRDDLGARLTDLTAAVASGNPGLVATDPYAQVIGPGRQVLAASPNAPLESLLTADELSRAQHHYLLVERQVSHLPGTSLLEARQVEDGSAVVVAGVSLQPVTQVENRLLAGLLVALPLLVAAMTLGVRRIVGAVLQPVSQLTDRAAAISELNLSERLPQPGGHDEIAQLARTMNRMLARLEVGVLRERAFIDDASHELRTPLAVLRGELELALTADDSTEVQQGLKAALLEAERLSDLASGLLALARAGSPAPERQRFDLLQVTRSVVERLRLAAQRAAPDAPEVRVVVHGSRTVVEADRRAMEQLVTNLVTNAAAAGARNVRVTVRPGALPGVAAHAGAGRVVIQVEDDGPGFPADVLPRAFERFTKGTTSRTSVGTGLGLAIVAAIARAHEGEAHADNGSRLGGARVTVMLRQDPPSLPRGSSPSPRR
ncbi:MAG TPA: HAMP domain-containing sensor histidine kinase [Actinomycetales bacterium]|nr:HAMP domain-containing sensor histidine kinase [Actinomycetales bacterium]